MEQSLSLEKKVYAIVEKYKNNLPIENDRYRLGYCLFKFMNGEGDSPEITVKTNKLTLEGITEKELGEKLASELQELK